jgi:hypothetical protein
MTPNQEMVMKIRPDDLNMSIRTTVPVVIWAWILYCIMSIYSTPAYPSERGRHDDIVVESDVRVEGDAVESSSDSSSNSNSRSQSGSLSQSVGEGGSANVSTSSENNSIVLTGARDSAACFTKMGVGAEGFGIFWSRSDPYCKKVRLIARHIDNGNFEAAARLECTLKEWKDVYGHKRVDDPGYSQCMEDLVVTPPPQPLPVSDYEEHMEEVEALKIEQDRLEMQLAEQRELLYMQQEIIESPPVQQEPFITDEKADRVLQVLKRRRNDE